MDEPTPSPIFLIGGPTAGGKSGLALRLAETTGAEIVNTDALQLYRDLRILSARPAPEDEARAPHHLFGTVDGAEGWTVGRWLAAATACLDAIAARGRPAVVVGGTGLYFKALTEGLADIPQVPRSVRLETQARYDSLGEAAFRQELGERDPAAAARIAAGDRQRLVRAFEVHLSTGRALSDWQASTSPRLRADAWRAVILAPPRADLYARCDARFATMVAAGALEEVRALTARDLDPELPVLKAVGVRELTRHLAGEFALADAIALAQRETRRYAKRQMTWFRRQTPDWPVVEADDAETQWRQFLALQPALTLR